MSLQSRLGCWWIRLTMKRKPPGEAALVDFTRRRFNPPGWIVSMHSLGMKIERVDSPVKGEWISDPKAAASNRIIYYLHGGGYISGSAKTGRPLTAPLARQMGVRIFTIDYRLAPEHRFPAGLEDVVAGYRWLLETGIEPRNISVMGDSAGGGLTLALAMKLRDSRMPLPAGLVCLSPWTDMTGNSASIKANAERDPMFVAEDCLRYSSAYLGEHSRLDPLASPLLGDVTGLPPMLLQVGRDEVLLDDARSLDEKVRASGGSSQLHVYDAVPHGWHFGAPFVPETNEALREIAEFIRRH
ncbi:MAG TPA: alpha/beta hydrolase [Chthoniobacterales bacterium]|nr:alpha/beta hydrolase [Chthoniobacterales bacterium]